MKKSYQEKLVQKFYSMVQPNNEDEENLLDIHYQNETKQNITNQSTQILIDSSSLKKNLTSKTITTVSFIFPLAYFITAISSTFFLILMSIIKESHLPNTNRFILHPLPCFYSLNLTQPVIFHSSIFLLSFIGLLNVWFYCSMLLQRFSVPELQSKKIGIHTMFVLGILANLLYILFGISRSFLIVEKIVINDVKISLTTITFLTFVFFNILFALFAVLSLQALQHHTQDCNMKKESLNIKEKIKVKRFIIYLAVFIMAIYIIAITIKNHEHVEKNSQLRTKLSLLLEIVVFILPYAIYVVNAFINLSCYSDVIYIQKSLMTVIDKEYFEPEEFQQRVRENLIIEKEPYCT
jgi:hypothetical protein